MNFKRLHTLDLDTANLGRFKRYPRKIKKIIKKQAYGKRTKLRFKVMPYGFYLYYVK